MISYSSSSEAVAYIFLSILVLVVAGCLLNILYFLIMCLSSRPENDELINVNLPV